MQNAMKDRKAVKPKKAKYTYSGPSALGKPGSSGYTYQGPTALGKPKGKGKATYTGAM